MKPVTHILFSEAFCMIFATFANIVLKPIDLAVIAMASVLPDIDDTRSFIGRVFHSVSSYLERNLGRRTITHSLAGLGIVAVVLSLLLFLKAGVAYSMTLLSILGHIIIDCVNKEGVNMFYPNLARVVIPKDEKIRIGENSKAENVLSCVFVGLLLFLFPLNQTGIRPALHYLIRTPDAAVTDYETFSGEGYRVMVDFKGVKNISQEKIKGAWEVIDLAAKHSLIIKDTEGKLYRIGNDITDNIRPIKIRAIKDRKQNQLTQKIIMKNNILSDILFAVPRESESYLSGYIKTDENIPVRKEEIDSYQSIRQVSGKIELSSATLGDLIEKGLLNIFVEEGQIVVRTVYPASIHVHEPSGREITLGQSKSMIVIVKEIDNHDDILVKEDNKVKEGQILAVLHDKKDIKFIELNKSESTLAAAKSELKTLKSRISAVLKEKAMEDKILGIKRELKQLRISQSQELQKAYHKVHLCHLAVTRTIESMRSLETLSPCDGKVASVSYRDKIAKITVIEDGE